RRHGDAQVGKVDRGGGEPRVIRVMARAPCVTTILREALQRAEIAGVDDEFPGHPIEPARLESADKRAECFVGEVRVARAGKDQIAVKNTLFDQPGGEKTGFETM